MTKILLLLSAELATWLRIAAARQNISRVEYIRRVLELARSNEEASEQVARDTFGKTLEIEK